MKLKQWLLRSSLIALLSFSFAVPMFAQDETLPTEDSSIEQVTEDTQGFLDEVITSLDNLIAPYVAVALPLIMVLVQLTKPIVPASISADWLKRGWAIIIFAVFVFFARAGFANQFNALVPALATILATVTGLTAVTAGSSALYDQVKGAPLIGYSRNEDA